MSKVPMQQWYPDTHIADTANLTLEDRPSQPIAPALVRIAVTGNTRAIPASPVCTMVARTSPSGTTSSR